MNCKLQDRDWGILRAVEEWRILRSDQVMHLCGFSSLAKAQDLCNRRVRALFDLHVVNKQSPRVYKGTDRQYIWVDRAGYILLGKPVKYRKELPIDYLHTTSIVDAYLMVRSVTGLEIVECWHEQPAVTATIIPDLVFVLRAALGYVFFVEVDRGLTREEQELAKIERYAQWKLSERWRNEPWARYMGSRPRFPPLIYLLNDDSKASQKRGCALQEAAQRRGLTLYHAPLHECTILFQQLITA